MRLLAKEPEARYADASAVVAALGRVLDRSTTKAAPAAAAETLIVPAQSPSRLPLIAGAVTAVLAGAAIMLIARGGHHDAPPKPAPAPAAQVTPAPPPPHVDPPAPIHENVEPTVQQLAPPVDPVKPVRKPKHLKTANGSPIEDKL